MWIKAQDGHVYRRDAFYAFEVESIVDAGIHHHFVRAHLKPPETNASASALKSVDPNSVTLGDYRTADVARHALERLFPEKTELVDLTVDVEAEVGREGD